MQAAVREKLLPHRDAQLAEILLAHLNDTRYYICENAADILRWSFMRRVSE